MKRALRSGAKVEIRISDPWDSKKILVGTLHDWIFIDGLASILIQTEQGNWIALLPKYKSQDLSDISLGKPIVVSVAILDSAIDLSLKHLPSNSILDYASGSAQIVK